MFNLSTCLQLHHTSCQIDAVGKFKYLSNLIDSSLSWRLCRFEFSFSEKKNYFHSWEVLCSTKGDFNIEFTKVWKVRSKICTPFFPLIYSIRSIVCMHYSKTYCILLGTATIGKFLFNLVSEKRNVGEYFLLLGEAGKVVCTATVKYKRSKQA